jgi:hypothetical protein
MPEMKFKPIEYSSKEEMQGLRLVRFLFSRVTLSRLSGQVSGVVELYRI